MVVSSMTALNRKIGWCGQGVRVGAFEWARLLHSDGAGVEFGRDGARRMGNSRQRGVDFAVIEAFDCTEQLKSSTEYEASARRPTAEEDEAIRRGIEKDPAS
jgi:hypothetical protein